MKDLLWMLGILLVTLFGLVTWRIPLVRRLGMGARLAIAFASGCVSLAAVMFAFSVVHVPFTRATLLGAMIVLAGVALWRTGTLACPPRPKDRQECLSSTLIAVFVLLTVYGVLTARETCADLLYFWGPKGQRFYQAEKIDTAFLAFPHYRLMHPDYPPLLPLVYAFASSIAHGFSWWGALLLMVVLLGATTGAFWGLARDALGDERAGMYAMLLAGILAYGYARSMVGGAGEPMLLLFETIAVAALTFHDDRDGTILAAIALAGAAWTKVEGAAFVVIVVAAFLVTRRRVVHAIAAAVPAAMLLGAWLFFAKHFNFIDQYGRVEQTMHVDALPTVGKALVRQASYGAFYLPWLAAGAPFAFGRNWRRAALPLLVVLGLVASTLYFYLHGDAPVWWIESSAERVLLSALMALSVAAAAASE